MHLNDSFLRIVDVITTLEKPLPAKYLSSCLLSMLWTIIPGSKFRNLCSFQSLKLFSTIDCLSLSSSHHISCFSAWLVVSRTMVLICRIYLSMLVASSGALGVVLSTKIIMVVTNITMISMLGRMMLVFMVVVILMLKDTIIVMLMIMILLVLTAMLITVVMISVQQRCGLVDLLKEKVEV